MDKIYKISIFNFQFPGWKNSYMVERQLLPVLENILQYWKASCKTLSAQTFVDAILSRWSNHIMG